MGEEPGPRAEACARLAACPLKLSWFLSQILIIILVPDNHLFMRTRTLEHLRSHIVVEDDSSVLCTLMTLVKWEGSACGLLARGNSQ
jgi:hypothetical protein